MSGGGSDGRRELHLHVGLPKTGTSSIQTTLKGNREAFAAAGFAVPPTDDPWGGHHGLFELLERDGPQALAAALTEMDGERLLVSSEYFSRMLYDRERLGALARALEQRFDVTIYLFLRPQYTQKESSYAQNVKIRRIGPIRPQPDPAAARKGGEGVIYWDPDYDAIAGNLEAAFGVEALRIGIFDPVRTGDAVDAFLDLLGAAPADLTRAPRINESIDRRRTLFLSYMAKPDPDLAWFAFEVIRRTRRLRDDGGRRLMSPAERRAAMAPYLEGNRRVVARHRPAHGEALLTLPEDDPEWAPPEPIRLVEFLGVGVSLARQAWRRPLPLRRRLHDAGRLVALTFDAFCVARGLRKG